MEGERRGWRRRGSGVEEFRVGISGYMEELPWSAAREREPWFPGERGGDGGEGVMAEPYQSLRRWSGG